MTEVFITILAVVYVFSLMAFAGLMIWQHGWIQILKDKREEVLRQQDELKTTLAAMNKFHNENIDHRKKIDAEIKAHTQQLSALTQANAAQKPGFMR